MRRDVGTFKSGRNALAAILAMFGALAPHQASAAELNKAAHDLLPDSIKTSGVIRIGSPRTIPPEVFQKDGQLVGVAVDASRAMEPILGVRFDWMDMQWPGIIPGLQGGSIDVSWGIMSYLPERAKFLNLIPFNKDIVGLITQPDATGLSSAPSSLCGHAIGGIQGTNYATYATEESRKCVADGKPAIKHQIYANSGAVLVAFQAGNVEGFITSLSNVLDINQSAGGKYKTYAMAGWASPPEAIVTSKENLALAQALQAALKVLQDDGTYKVIMDKYGVGDEAMSPAETTINP